MNIEKLFWMRDSLKEMVIATELMLKDTQGHTPEPEAFEKEDCLASVTEDEQEISVEEIKVLGLALNQKGGRKAVVKYMSLLGVDNLQKLPKENYARALEIGHELLIEVGQ